MSNIHTIVIALEETTNGIFNNPQINSIVQDLKTKSDVSVISFSKSRKKETGDRYTVILNPNLPKYIRIIDGLIRFTIISRRVVNSSNNSIIYCINMPSLIPLTFSNNHKAIYHALEIFDEMSSIPKSIRKFIKFFEKYAVKRHTDRIIAPSRLRKTYYQDRYPKSHIDIWFNCPSIQEIQSIQIKRKEFNNKILYAGSMGNHRDLSPFIDALSELGGIYEIDIYTNLPESNPYHTKLSDYARVKDVTINWKGFINGRGKLIEEMSKYPATIAIYDGKGTNNLLCAPTKLIDAHIASTNWVCNDLPGSKDQAEYFKSGYIFKDNDTTSLIDAIRSAMTGKFTTSGANPSGDRDRILSEVYHDKKI